MRHCEIAAELHSWIGPNRVPGTQVSKLSSKSRQEALPAFSFLAWTEALGYNAPSVELPLRLNASLYFLALGGAPAQIGWVSSVQPLAALLIFFIAGHVANLTCRALVGWRGHLLGAGPIALCPGAGLAGDRPGC